MQQLHTSARCVPGTHHTLSCISAAYPAPHSTLHSALATAVCAAERALLGWSRCLTSSFPFSRSHVVDLAEGHVSALKRIESSKEPYCDPINLGTGTGTSVLGMIKVLHSCDSLVTGCHPPQCEEA